MNVKNGIRLMGNLGELLAMPEGEQRASIHCENGTLRERRGYGAIGNALCQAMHDRVFSHAGFANQDRLFLVRRAKIWMVRSSSCSRPIKGLSAPLRAAALSSRGPLHRCTKSRGMRRPGDRRAGCR